MTELQLWVKSLPSPPSPKNHNHLPLTAQNKGQGSVGHPETGKDSNKASQPFPWKCFIYLFLTRLKTKAIPYFRIPNNFHSTEWREFSKKTIALYPDLLSYWEYCNEASEQSGGWQVPLCCGWFHWVLAAFVPTDLFNVLFPTVGEGLVIIGTGTDAPTGTDPAGHLPSCLPQDRPEARWQAVLH